MKTKISYLEYCKSVFDGKFETSPFQEKVAESFESVIKGDCKRLVIQCPPKSGKTTLSKLLLSYLKGSDSLSNHFLISYSQQVASNSGKEVKAYTKTPQFKEFFPKFNPEEGALLPVGNFGSVCGFCYGTTSPPIEGVGIALYDDPFRPNYTEKDINLFLEWRKQVTSVRGIGNCAEIIFYSHCFNPSIDFLGKLTKGEEWKVLKISNLCGHSDYPSPDLEEIRTSIGDRAFQSLYQFSLP
jgi:hypothetical protein